MTGTLSAGVSAPAAAGFATLRTDTRTARTVSCPWRPCGRRLSSSSEGASCQRRATARSARSGSSGWAPWVPASRRCSRAAGCRSSPSRSATRRWSAGASTWSSPPTARWPAASSTAAERDAIFGRIRFTTSLDGPRRPPSWSSRRCPSGWSSSGEIFAQLDKICPPDAILATNTSRLSVTELSVATGRPEQGRRHALLQPGAGHEARRGRAHRRHRAVGRRATSRRWPSASARSSCIGDKAGFIANALLFGYLNHAVVDVRDAGTPAARTSTRPCGWAAACRWARWR